MNYDIFPQTPRGTDHICLPFHRVMYFSQLALDLEREIKLAYERIIKRCLMFKISRRFSTTLVFKVRAPKLLKF